MKRLLRILSFPLVTIFLAAILSGCPQGLINDPSLSASPHRGPAPLTVELTMTDAHDYEAFEWIPGDGTPLLQGDSDRLTHTYTSPGVYYACCFAYDNESLDFDTGAYVKITVTEPGFAASIETLSGIAAHCYNPEGLEVAFTRDVSGGEPPYSFYWNFGDGERAYDDADPMYHYYFPDAPGVSYTVELTVTDSTTAVVYSNQITIDVVDCSFDF